jgi:hypothetical protein
MLQGLALRGSVWRVTIPIKQKNRIAQKVIRFALNLYNNYLRWAGCSVFTVGLSFFSRE